MLGIKDAIKKIYSGEDALTKHIILFVLTGVPVMLSTPLNDISKRQDLSGSTILLSLAALFISLVIAIYLGGYLYGLIHNSFDTNRDEILPDLDKSWFNIFFKGLPLQIIWILYIMLIIGIGALVSAILTPFLGVQASSVIGTLLSGVVIVFLCIMLPFIFTIFARDYNRQGLYNIKLPFSFIPKTLKSVAWLLIKLVPIFIVVSFVNILGDGNNVVSYIFTALGAYLAAIMQYITCFCYVQIYKEELEQ